MALWGRRPRRDPWPCPCGGVTGLIAARASRRENGGQTTFFAPVEARRDACRAYEGVLNYAEEVGFVVLAVGDEVMEVKNRPGFEPRR